MPLSAKSAENIAAARVLVAQHPNAAASRAYYAFYQAAWCALHAFNKRPAVQDGGARYWLHKSLVDELHGAGLLIDPNDHDTATLLLQSRVKADYHPDTLEETESRARLDDAARLIDVLATNRGGL